MPDGLPGVVCMTDDIVLSGDSCEEHDARRKAGLKRLEENGVTLNFRKCDSRNPAFHTWVTWIQPRGSRLTQQKCKRS